MSRQVYLSIDSRDRERTEDGSGDYTVKLMEPIRDINTVTVRSMDIPPMWNLSPGRSSIWASVSGGVFREVVIAPGDHDADSLPVATKQALDAATAATWNVSIDANTRRVEFSASLPFSLREGDGVHRDGYGPRSAGRVLGLAPTVVLASATGGAVVAPHTHQISRGESMYLHIDEFSVVDASSAGAQNCTEVVVRKKGGYGYNHDKMATKSFHPSLGRLHRLRIRITDFYGNPVDFDNREHRIDLLLETSGLVPR